MPRLPVRRTGLARTPAGQATLAGLATAAATLVCMGLDASMSVAALALVYLVAVVLTAALLARWAGVLTSVASVSALNYFFVPPRHSFRIDGPEYLLTLAILLAVSLGINALVANLRARRAQAERRARQAGELHELSEQLAEGQEPQAVAQVAARWLATRLGRPCAVFLRPGSAPAALPRDGASLAGELLCHGAPQGPGDAAPRFHAASAAWAMAQRRPVGRGSPDWPDLPLWCAPFAGPHPGGAVQILLDDAAPVQPDKETLGHWLALARQTGLSVERERAAAEARAAQDSARSEATRNALLASLSHDLRTPLAGILGSASALREQGDAMPAAQRTRLLANLEDEAHDMTLMVDNILQMARLSQAPCRIRLQWESLEEIIGVEVQRLRRRWPGARIRWRVGRRLPPIQAEAGLLAQVLANLVDNAARHGGPGGAPADILIRAGRTRAGVFIAVRDHGPGLPDGDPATLFKRFHQGAPPRRGDAGAAGLGLSLCQTIVQAHGGRIAARRCAPGAEFRIELPVAAAAPPGAGHA